MLGLVSSETIDDFWTQNTRRRIFYAYPNGTAPLTGFLSLMESQDTPIPEFGWNEERWTPIKTTTVAGPATTGNKTGPFTTAGGTTPSGDSNGQFDVAAFDAIRVYVADASNFQIDDTVRIFNLGIDPTGPVQTDTTDIVGRVTLTGTGFIEIEFSLAYLNLLNVAAASLTRYVLLMASAFAEGARSRTGRIRVPSEIKNYTQIHKTAFELTRTALKEPLKYDKTGAYADTCKNNSIDHLSFIEWTAFFGERNKTTTTDPTTGAVVSRRLTGGLRWFLDQWEAGTLYGTPDIRAASYLDEPNKRVIKLGGNTINKPTFNTLMARLFERTNNTSWDKLCFCGPDYLPKVADYFEKQVTYTNVRENNMDGFDFELVQHRSNSGTIYYKQHPLFTDPIMRNSAFYIDLGYMGYRPLTDSDTDIQSGIQDNDADKRKDQWLTEFGFEIRYPEAFMYVENLGGITA